MTWWEAIILGIVEGLTEYLPVSSTGHLILAQRAMGMEINQASAAYAICIQAGAILAVVGLYWSRVTQMGKGVVGMDPTGKRLAINIVIGFLPAVVAGLLLDDLIKTYLFGGDRWDLWPTVLAWLVGGVAILYVARWQRRKRAAAGEDEAVPHDERGIDLAAMTWKMALIIGLLQCVAMWPGVSRSLMTILAGLLVGLSLRSAVEYSFLLGGLTLSAATAYDGLKHHEVMLESYGVAPLAIGFVFAFISAAIAVKWFVTYLRQHSLAIFGYYRIGLAALVAVLLLTGAMRTTAAPQPADAMPTAQPALAP